MESRTCPYCDYKYSRMDYAKRLLFKVVWSKWDCEKCNQEITFDKKRRLFVSILFGLLVLILNIAKNHFTMDFILWFLFFVIFLGGTILIFTFDNFTKTNNYINIYLRCS